MSASNRPPERRQRMILAVLSTAAFMASLDLFIVNVAFSSIGRDFHQSSFSNLSWVLNCYAIVYAALLIPFGRIADRVGRKLIFLLGLGVFTAASLGCALSPSLWPLVGFRFLQAAGAAAMTPTSLGLLINAFPPERRSGAVRVWAAVSALAAAAGPVIGGVLVQHSWRLVFLVNLPVGIAALLVALKVVPDSKEAEASSLPDLLGSVLLALAIGALALGLVKGTAWGWTSPETFGTLALAVASGAVFWWRSLTHASPVVDPALLRVRPFAWSNLTMLVFSVAFAANLLLGILWMQEVWHFSPIATGLGVAPGPLMVPGFALFGGGLARRLGVGRLTAIGCVVMGSSVLLSQLLLGETPHYLTEMLPAQLLFGIGVGLALPTILSAGTAGLPMAQAATGSAVVNMNRQIGSVLGVSILVALLGAPLSYAAAASGFTHVRVACIIALVLAALAAVGMTPKAAAETRSVGEACPELSVA
jgi:EmrB/QacA subfamily drug resistance transporter